MEGLFFGGPHCVRLCFRVVANRKTIHSDAKVLDFDVLVTLGEQECDLIVSRITNA
jgi:hypothetical protein